MRQIHLALVGDSDIARWPNSQIPEVEIGGQDEASIVSMTHSLSGLNGGALSEIIPLVNEAVAQYNPYTQDRETSKDVPDALILVVCAGENDISTLTIEDTMNSLRQLFSLVHDANQDGNNCASASKRRGAPQQAEKGKSNAIINKIRLIFLGPKLEPWLQYDKDARNDYIRMSQRMERMFDTTYKEENDESGKKASDTVTTIFIDSLVLFCGSTGHVPGALWGGRAIPETRYFDHDELHLSPKGYQIWKQVVEDCVSQHFLRI